MGKHRYILVFFSLFIVTFCFGATAQAMTFEIAADDAQGFQNALDDSAANEEDDVINLAAGTYSTGDLTVPDAFLFQSNKANSLTINGAGKESTFLDGGGMGGTQVMALQLVAGSGNQLVVMNLTIQNGELNGDGAGALIVTQDVDLNIMGCEFKNNTSTGGIGGGLSIQSTGGSASLSDNRFFQNKTSEEDGGLALQGVGSEFILLTNHFEMNQADFDTGGAFFSVLNGSLSLDGNTFKQNRADFEDDNLGSNGGFNIQMLSGTLSLENNTLEENQAFSQGGGNIRTDGVEIILKNNTFLKNTAEDRIGGLGISQESGSLLFSDNKILENKAVEIGGLALETLAGALHIENNRIEKNMTDGDQAGIVVQMESGTINFIGNRLIENAAGGNVGGMELEGTEALMTVRSNLFMGNSAGNLPIGGDVGAAQFEPEGGTFTFDANTILNNSAHAGGSEDGAVGGIQTFHEDLRLVFTNNIFSGNMAEGDAGGAWLEDTGSSGSRMDIINNTFTENSGDDAGGLLLILRDLPDASANIYNNSLFGNSAVIMPLDNLVFDDDNASPFGNLVNIFNNDLPSFFSQCENTGGCMPRIIEMANINQDPMFVDASMDDFRLLGTSPLIDMGTADAPSLPEFDHDGNPRIFGSAPDIGALEAVPALAVSAESLDFGNVFINDTLMMGLTISNEGTFDLAVSDLLLLDSTNYSLNPNGGADPCGSTSFTLAFGDSCTVEITFGPTVEGGLDATLTIDSDDPSIPELIVALLGVGILPQPDGGGGCSCGLHAAASSSLSYGIYFLLMPLGWWLWRRAKNN